MNQAMFIEDENSKHPAIPPNCPYFESHANLGIPSQWRFVARPAVDMFVDKASPMFRPIIAAVARCAWLDECIRLDAILGDVCNSNCEADNPADIVSTSSIRHALQKTKINAEAWRIWGLAK